MRSERPLRGSAELRVGTVAGRSAVLRSQARNPLRLLTPRTQGNSVWAYTSSFGGGMVAGDETSLHVQVDSGASCFLSTQASTKIYRNPAALPCAHTVRAQIGEGASLVLAPDPVQCFAASRYDQRQRFDLAADSSLVLVDWMSAGRTARGERWAFSRYSSRNEIWRADAPVLIDAMLLDSTHGALDATYRGGRFNCLATVVMLGPPLEAHARDTLDWCQEQPVTPGAGLVLAASPLREGALLRVAGISVEEVARAIYQRLRFVRELLNDDPWERKW